MADVALDAPEEGQPAARRAEAHVPIEEIAPNPAQPRRAFDEASLAELAESIRSKGVLSPLIVRPAPAGPARYEIVAGERRWRAAQLAQLHALPVIVRELDDREVLEVAIVENIQRADLNPVEEARGYRQLIEAFGHTQEQLARVLGKSRSHIANQMRLLALPDEVLAMLAEGRLSAGHARALLTTDAPLELARRVASRGLSVRETEKLAKGNGKTTSPGGPRARAEKDSDTVAIEQDLSANLGMRVSIAHKDIDGAGELVIRYRSLDDLDKLCQMLSAMPPDGSL
jgi:ParB family chromosome partitioning protein